MKPTIAPNLREEVDLVKTVFSNPNGEKLLAKWKLQYGDRQSFQPNHTPETTAFFEGERAVYLAIMQMIEIEI